MSADNSNFFDNPINLASYSRAKKITWWGKPSAFQKPTVYWEAGDALKAIRETISCSETDLLKFHHLENLAASYGLGTIRDKVIDIKQHNRMILRYFMTLSRRIKKPIELYCQKSIWDKRYTFDLSVSPEMTWRSRLEDMRYLAVAAGEMIAEDSNVSHVFFGGSAQRGIRYPNDVDLLVVTEDLLNPDPREELPYSTPLTALPYINCKGREGNPFEYLHGITLLKVENQAKKAGLCLDCIIVQHGTFSNPVCCPTHARLIREFTEGLEISK